MSSELSPVLLTPESTPTQEQASSSAVTAPSPQKPRRQASFYPNMNASNKPLKPFSRSAAKRESVMTLGSIEHLQHYFTKTGIAAKHNALNSSRRGLVPAIGGLTHIKNASSKAAFDLPPSPAVPAPPPRPLFQPYVKMIETNPDTLLPGVVEDLTLVTKAWDVEQIYHPQTQNPELLRAGDNGTGRHPDFDVLSVLKLTTRAIRSIRNYVLSLPDESTGSIREQFRSTVTASAPVQRKPSPQQLTDPLTLIRRSALDVLTSLRELEEKSRVPLSDDVYDAQSDHGSPGMSQNSLSRVASPSSRTADLTLDGEVDPDASISFSYIQVQGRNESVPVWEEEDSSDSDEEKLEKRSHWDERLVLGSGWLYKQDVKLESLSEEREVIHNYLDLVDHVLFGGQKDGIRGWERERERVARKEKAEAKVRRVSAGDGDHFASFQFPPPPGRTRRVVSTSILDSMRSMALSEEPEHMDTLSESADESIDDEELPEWAKRTTFIDDPRGRAHSLMVALLPDALIPRLPLPTGRAIFLQGLSSGQLLCAAYNVGVRRSRKPWGYISKDAVHDIIALEKAAAEERDKDEKAKRTWTFRRTDNLRLWSAALRLRYLLPILAPPVATPQPSLEAPKPPGAPLTPSSPSMKRISSSNGEPPIYFDAAFVARREDGWEDMLENLLFKWMDIVVEERRGDR